MSGKKPPIKKNLLPLPFKTPSTGSSKQPKKEVKKFTLPPSPAQMKQEEAARKAARALVNLKNGKGSSSVFEPETSLYQQLLARLIKQKEKQQLQTQIEVPPKK